MSVRGRAVELVGGRGGPGLKVVKRTFAEPVGQEIRVVNEAAGVAFGDLLLREGLVRRDLTGLVPGYDAVGVIDAVGSEVTTVAVGDRVAVWTNGVGGYASHVTVSEDFAVPVPDALAAHQVAALTLNYTSAWQMLTRVAPVTEGSVVLVHGAGGGVGSALAEIADLRGASVLGTGSPSRAASFRARGIEPLDRMGDWAAAARRLHPAGVDAVFDSVGGRVTRQSLALLQPGGHLVVFGVSSALKAGRRSVAGLAALAVSAPRPSTIALFRRSIGVHGYASAEQVPAHPVWFRDDLGSVLAFAAEGRLRPRIAAHLPLAEAADAHALLSRGTSGKVVLDVAGGAA